VSIETERLRNSLLSSVSHDLRTPLATIKGAATTMLDNGVEARRLDARELLESVAGGERSAEPPRAETSWR